MRFKVGVSLSDLQPQAVLALVVCDEVYKHYGQDMVVTSINDGHHKPGSYHYAGKAFDLRTKTLGNDKRLVIDEIRRRLTCLGFDVVFEDEGKANEHLHLEHDPK